MPSATNHVWHQQLSLNGEPYAITDSLIQAARSQVSADIFGDPTENCKYAYHIKDALEVEGHITKLRFTSTHETIQNVEHIIISDKLLWLRMTIMSVLSINAASPTRHLMLSSLRKLSMGLTLVAVVAVPTGEMWCHVTAWQQL